MTLTKKTVKVGMADMGYCLAPNSIGSSGLGSCVAIVIYPANGAAAALAHVMLPDASIRRNDDFNRAKYADTAVPLLLETMQRLGPFRNATLRAKIAGGANMFQRLSTVDPMMKIGERNTEVAREALKQANIPIMADVTGGSEGRSVVFSLKDQSLSVRTIHSGTKIY
ncbi:chemotaxis protein CheD [Salicibibacter cibarius]|uniref:Probable chemoreceptor glutamine deamidase CheD n=1 Tax=Salicibibacter cibarius TaxID=2743000 RepID=A0A7T6Z4T0_9BACI|nr:chemotaxis protein CheD [Salicibibacter cibarius]QQK76361.1 chemotaxis protein CheD [Salicibibacter cibarius]